MSEALSFYACSLGCLTARSCSHARDGAGLLFDSDVVALEHAHHRGHREESAGGELFASGLALAKLLGGDHFQIVSEEFQIPVDTIATRN